MKATEQYFPVVLVVLFIMLYKVILAVLTVQMKTIEQYFQNDVTCFPILYKMKFNYLSPFKLEASFVRTNFC